MNLLFVLNLIILMISAPLGDLVLMSLALVGLCGTWLHGYCQRLDRQQKTVHRFIA